MVMPGITKNMLSKLKKKDSEVVARHLKKVDESTRKKKDMLDGKLEELGEKIKRPRKEVDQLTKIIKDVEGVASADMFSLLLALEVNTRELMRSIDEEHFLVEKIKKSKDTETKTIKKEIEGETVLGNIIEHQLNLLSSIKDLIKAAMKKLSSIKDKNKRELIGFNLENLDNIASYLSNIILHEEMPNLEISYNLLKLEEWPELKKRIAGIKSKFAEIEPHLL